jgi:hypothetical protein
MFLEFVAWWYGAGWLDITHRIGRRVVSILQLFSVSILIATLFSPWKRIISPPGKSIDQILRGMLDNLVSRTVGFFVRLFVLTTAFLMTTIATVIGFVAVVVWPLLPLGIIFCLFKGIIG